MANPFRVEGTVEPPYFTDRADEIDRIVRVLREPGAKLLVYGERRMGKTSTLRVAISQVERRGGHAFMADLSTASTVVDIANRVLDAAVRTLGRRWSDVGSELVKRIGVKLNLTSDPATGLILPTLDVGLRHAAVEDQRTTFGRVLDSVEELAAHHGEPVGVVLDEFQEIHEFGGEDAEWHLRGVIQNHRHVSYVLAGSETHLIRRMLGKRRAFYKMLDRMAFGAMEPVHLGRWIDERMEAAGVDVRGVGEACIEVAGPRTRDVVQLARKTYDMAARSGQASAADVVRAFEELVEEEDDLARALWSDLTPHQQNVLRAAAASEQGLTTRSTLERFSLGSSGAVSKTLKRFVADGHIIKVQRAPGYTFDSPFLRGWVVVNALPDLGIRLPSTYRADRAAHASERRESGNP